MKTYTRPCEFPPEVLDELFTYNVDNGRLYRRTTRGGKLKGTVAGFIRDDGYWYIRVQGKQYLGHILVWYMLKRAWPEYQIDHINGIKDDNRIENLRDVTQNENQVNRQKAPSNSESKLLGANKNTSKSMPWKSRITLPDGSRKSLGTFKTAEEASAAYLAARKEIYNV